MPVTNNHSTKKGVTEGETSINGKNKTKAGLPKKKRKKDF
jgi:hypothetical protein